MRASSVQSPGKNKTLILTLCFKRWRHMPQSCSKRLSTSGFSNKGRWFHSWLVGERKQPWTLFVSLLWPPFGIFECVTEPWLGHKDTWIPSQAKSAISLSQGRLVAAGPGEAIKSDGKMSNFECNNGTRCLPSQNLAPGLGVLPFSIKVGVLRTRSVNNNKILCATKCLW